MVIKVNITVNHLIGLGKGSGFVPVDALCFEDGEKFSAMALS